MYLFSNYFTYFYNCKKLIFNIKIKLLIYNIMYYILLRIISIKFFFHFFRKSKKKIKYKYIYIYILFKNFYYILFKIFYKYNSIYL